MGQNPKARVQDLVVEEVEQELVVYDQRSQTAHALSREAAAVWRACDGSTSVRDIAQQLGVEQAVVERALDQLRDADLLGDMITVRSGYSRREVAGKLARIGTAAVVAPLVYSVSIASASTCPCSLNKPGCTKDNCAAPTPGNCTGTGGKSGVKGCDCDCCSGVCYESNNSSGTNIWCVPATCLANGFAVASKAECTTLCCARACSGNSLTCGASAP